MRTCPEVGPLESIAGVVGECDAVGGAGLDAGAGAGKVSEAEAVATVAERGQSTQ